MKNKSTYQKYTITYPNYKKIYGDIIEMKFPEKKNSCKEILDQSELSVLDVIRLNKIIFDESQHKMHKSYDYRSIQKILRQQKDQNLNNSELSRKLGISRNTIAKWKKRFIV